MKINYSTTQRVRFDTIKIVMDIEEEADPVIKNRIMYQPTVLTVEFDREIRKATHSRDQDDHAWAMSTSIEGNRVLKAGGLGQQTVHLQFWDDDKPDWLNDAVKLAKEEFDKIISKWPDPSWPSSESLQIP